MQALIKTDEKFLTETIDSNDELLLNTNERAILHDSIKRQTSDELFERVR